MNHEAITMATKVINSRTGYIGGGMKIKQGVLPSAVKRVYALPQTNTT